MVTQDDWIRVELSKSNQDDAERIARGRHQRREGSAKEWGRAGLEGHRAGAYGEVAASIYLGLPVIDGPVPDDLDVGPYYVSTGEQAHHRLNIARLGKIRRGKYLFALAHEIPETVWLAGEIHSDEGERVGRWMETYRSRWFGIDQRYLYPLPERNGYCRRGSAWLIDPQSPFWCETCKGMHPIIEHRECRTSIV